MNTCDSEIEKFILEWQNVVRLLEARGLALTDRFQIMWRAFDLCKDTYFVEYMRRNQVTH